MHGIVAEDATCEYFLFACVSMQSDVLLPSLSFVYCWTRCALFFPFIPFMACRGYTLRHFFGNDCCMARTGCMLPKSRYGLFFPKTVVWPVWETRFSLRFFFWDSGGIGCPLAKHTQPFLFILYVHTLSVLWTRCAFFLVKSIACRSYMLLIWKTRSGLTHGAFLNVRKGSRLRSSLPLPQKNIRRLLFGT